MFDPYHKWLGIPTGKRPPNHYQLLAIAESEKDRDVIDAAAVRQSAYVRNFQKGPNADEAARILSEIADARSVLTDPVRRRTYDERLAAERPAPKAVVAVRPTVVPAQAVIVKAAPPPKPPRTPKRKSSKGVPVPILVGIVGVVAAASALGVYLATRGNDDASLSSNDKPPVERNPNENAQAPPVVQQQIPQDVPPPNPFQGAQNIPGRQNIPGPPQGMMPNPGRPPNFGPPNFGPPGLFRPPIGGPPAPNPGAGGKQAPPKGKGDEDLAPPEKKKKSHRERVEGIDDAIVRIADGGHFEIDAAAKYLILCPIDPKRKDEVAKVLNEAMMGEHLPESIYEAGAKWANDDTVKIFVDKLSARPWVERGVIKASGRIPNSEIALKLCYLLENFFNWEEATRALQQIGPVAEQHVRTLLTQHRDPKMRAQACLILASIGTERSLPALKKASGEKATALNAKAAMVEINERVKAKKEAEPIEEEEDSSTKGARK
jgi:hypothetical protein